MFKRTFVNLILVFAVLLTLGVSAASAAPPAQEELTYTVKLGDTLWALAEKYLGDGPAYHAIVAATNAKSGEGFANIVDPGLIQPGWKLLIPGAEGAAADGIWCYMPLGPPILVDVGFTPPGKQLWAGAYVAEWTGTFQGASQDTALMVAHEIDPGPPPIAAPMLYVGTVSFAEVEVDGVSSGLEMDLNMDILGDSPSTASPGTGRWIITSGTGDLEGFRAEGTWWGPGWNPEEPEKCGVIYYSVEDMSF